MKTLDAGTRIALKKKLLFPCYVEVMVRVTQCLYSAIERLNNSPIVKKHRQFYIYLLEPKIIIAVLFAPFYPNTNA